MANKSILIIIICAIHIALNAQIPAFPNAEGFGTTTTTGGRGGKVIYVTNLNCDGEGSLNWALQQVGKKYILFKVSGVIPCSAEIIQGDCYIAGQTSPGGVIVRGIIADDYFDKTNKPNNLIIRHLRSRGIGSHPLSGFAADPIILSGVENAVIDHCTFAHSEDEAVDISRSSNITIQNCMLAETIGDHADLGGMLLNYSSPGQVMDKISIHHNCWNRIGGRMPEFSCEDPTGCTGATMQIECSNNLFWDQHIQVWHNADTDLSKDNVQPYGLAINFVNNYSVSRSTYNGPMFSFDFLSNNKNSIYTSGNKMNQYANYSDYQLFYCCNDFKEAGNNPNTANGTATKLTTRNNYPTISYTPTNQVQSYMVQNVGAFPRFAMENRLIKPLSDNKIEEKPVDKIWVDDALTLPFTTQPTPPKDTDSDGMPDDWEKANGLNVNVQDHNGTTLSKKYTGIEGYTNLECYLNCLAESVLKGSNQCLLTSLSDIDADNISIMSVTPNPIINKQLKIRIESPKDMNMPFIKISNLMGQTVFQQKMDNIQKGESNIELNVSHMNAGLYILQLWENQKIIGIQKLVIND